MNVLVVIDMQEKYLDRYDNGLVRRVNEKISEAQAEGVNVLYVKNIGASCVNNTGNSEKAALYKLADDLLVVSNLVFEKKAPSAFTSDKFVHTLEMLQPDSLELIGIDGSCCVAKTAMDAVQWGYQTKVLLTYVGARNEKIFEKTCEKMIETGVILQNSL